MTVLGPAGIIIIAFVGFISALAATYSIEEAVRGAVRSPRGR